MELIRLLSLLPFKGQSSVIYFTSFYYLYIFILLIESRLLKP